MVSFSETYIDPSTLGSKQEIMPTSVRHLPTCGGGDLLARKSYVVPKCKKKKKNENKIK